MRMLARPAVAVLLTAGLAACGHGSRHKTAAPSPSRSVVPSARPLSSPSAAALAGRLTSGNEAELRSAMAIPSGQALDPAAAHQFAALGPITFDLATFQYLNPITATMDGHVAHPPAGTATDWTFTLVYVAPDWRLVDGSPRP
jgi:hypothetical protein